MRKIELHITDKFRETTGDTPSNVVEAAIGRLAMWAEHNERYSNVVIRGAHDGCIDATYRNDAGEVTYGLFMEYDPTTKTYSGPHS